MVCTGDASGGHGTEDEHKRRRAADCKLGREADWVVKRALVREA